MVQESSEERRARMEKAKAGLCAYCDSALIDCKPSDLHPEEEDGKYDAA